MHVMLSLDLAQATKDQRDGLDAVLQKAGWTKLPVTTTWAVRYTAGDRSGIANHVLATLAQANQQYGTRYLGAWAQIGDAPAQKII